MSDWFSKLVKRFGLVLAIMIASLGAGKKSRAEKEEKKGPRRPEKKKNCKEAAIQKKAEEEKK